MSPPKAPTDDEILGKPTFPFVSNRHYSMEDFGPYFASKFALPKFEPVPLWQVASAAIHFYGHLVEGKYAATVEHPGIYQRALYMLSAGQGGGLTGEGYVLISCGYANDESRIVSGRFALCKHQKVEGHGADHDHGWHPGHCRLCGLNMNVDSGD